MNVKNDACQLFLERLNGVLDGDLELPRLTNDGHVADCLDCRSRFVAAMKLTAHTPVIPALQPSFTENVVRAVVADRSVVRRQMILIQASVVALAASLAIGVWLLWPQQTAPAPQPELAAIPPGGVIKPLNDARDAVVALGSKVADDALTPASNLLALGSEKPKPMESPASVSPFSELPDAARAGFEPLVSTPRRALNLFIRDVGGAAGRKTDS